MVKAFDNRNTLENYWWGTISRKLKVTARGVEPSHAINKDDPDRNFFLVICLKKS